MLAATKFCSRLPARCQLGQPNRNHGGPISRRLRIFRFTAGSTTKQTYPPRSRR